MKSSGIGGQAVLEGVMMRYKSNIAVAVRKANGEIVVGKRKTILPKDKCKIFGWPVIRGVAAFISSLVVGIKTMMYSAEIAMEDIAEEDEKEKKQKEEKQKEKAGPESAPKDKNDSKKGGAAQSAALTGTLVFSLCLALVVFFLAPYYAAEGIMWLLGSESTVLLAIIEGVIKLAVFIGYIAAISMMKDIRRTFMYHGAEHKSINCIESGHELTVENAMKASREHRRCGTSFIFFVLFISIIFFVFIRFDAMWLKFIVRILLIPVIAGLSFEFIQWAGNSDSKAAAVLSKPGLWIQALTTKEPTPDMQEVAIASVEAVFDWRAYLREQGIKVSEEKASASDSANVFTPDAAVGNQDDTSGEAVK